MLKRGQAYDPAMDRKQRVKELRVVYEARMQEREVGKGEEREDDDEGSEITKGLHTYFTSMSILTRSKDSADLIDEQLRRRKEKQADIGGSSAAPQMPRVPLDELEHK